MLSEKVLSLPGGSTSTSPGVAVKRPSLLTLLMLSAWCGIVSGLLEAGIIVLRKQAFDSNQLYAMPRQFVWLIPTTNLCLFVAVGIVSWLAVLAWPQRGSWLVTRVLCALTMLSTLLVAFPRIYSYTWLIVALGIATWFVPMLARHASGFHRLVRLSSPVVAGFVPMLAVCFWGSDRIQEWRRNRCQCHRPGRQTCF